ncbi:phosphatidylinositol 3,4,5-trisphosphate 3-phosphatase TPTE2-like isoform 3-T3 [Thomomys bottae]
MISILLLATGTFLTAKDSLNDFGERKTDTSFSNKIQGVEMPAQSRYVGYFDIVKNVLNWEMPVKKTFKIRKIVIYSIQALTETDVADG